jgi:hypothetical protein
VAAAAAAAVVVEFDGGTGAVDGVPVAVYNIFFLSLRFCSKSFPFVSGMLFISTL